MDLNQNGNTLEVNSSKIVITLILISIISLNLMGCQITPSNNETNSNLLNFKDFNEAKKIIPGKWVATEQITSNWIQYDLLLFNNDGSLKFSQGASLDQALRLANESTLVGRWSINEDPKYISDLITEKRFLLEFYLEGVGAELVRVEIDPSNKHRMGRGINDFDLNREAQGLFSFGGKIFFKN